MGEERMQRMARKVSNIRPSGVVILLLGLLAAVLGSVLAT